MKSGKITVTKAYSAQVAGLTVFLDGASNQMEGNLVQGASRALLEGVDVQHEARRRASTG